MPDNPDHGARGHAAPTPAMPDWAMPIPMRSFRARVTQPRFSAVQVLAIALGGPLVFATVTWLVDPDVPWPMLFMEAIDNGWMSPLMVLAVAAIMIQAIEVRRIRAVRNVLRGSSMLVGMIAVRARYYAGEGHANAVDMALREMANYRPPLALRKDGQ